jgi:putative DNA primase/helicase
MMRPDVEAELERIRRERKAREAKSGKGNSEQDGPFTRASEIEMKTINWLWSNHLARKKITMLAGDPDLGKSQIATSMAASLTKTGEWPDGDPAPRGSVIILSAEDSIDDTIVPRLAAAGADLTLVYCLRFVCDEQGRPRSFSIQQDLEILAQKVRALGDVALVIIDPITSYLGTKIDSHKITDVRAALYPLAQFAETHNVAVLCIAHPPKAPSAKAINFIGGSGAFTAAPRLVFLTITDPENKDRALMLAVKNNIGRKAEGLGYSIMQRFVDPDESILASYIEFDDRPVNCTADEALAAAGEKRKGDAVADAEEFLRDRLGNGAGQLSTDIEGEAEALGISRPTLKRARKRLGVRATKNGYADGWRLFLDKERAGGKDA